MRYDERDLAAEVRRIIDAQPVPDRPLRGRPHRSGNWAIGIVTALVVLLVIVGVRVGTGGVLAPLSPPVTTGLSSAPIAAERVELPPAMDPRVSLVSPDAALVAAVTRDRSELVLYRITRSSPPTEVVSLLPLATVRGPIDDLAWLEDSSGLLVRAPAGSAGSSLPSPLPVQFVGADGRVQTVSDSTISFGAGRLALSPDRRGVAVGGGCCGRMLSLQTLTAVDLGPAPTDGSRVAFVGWDADGLLLVEQTWPDRSTLRALDRDGSERYNVPAPFEFGGASWQVIARAEDRSWQLVSFRRGPGAAPGFRVLVDRHLRELPADVERAGPYGLAARGDAIVYVGTQGVLGAYDVRTGAVRDLSLRLDAVATGRGLTTVGLLGATFVWFEGARAFVGDLDSGAVAELPLQSPPRVDRLDGTNVVEYRSDAISIINVSVWLQRYR